MLECIPHSNRILRKAAVVRTTLGLVSLMLLPTLCLGFDAPALTGPRVIGPDDILQIEALVDGLNVRRSVVEPDGSLALGPRWGRVQVAGKNILEVEKVVRDHIASHVQNPEVQVTFAGRSVDGSVGGRESDASEIVAKLKQFERDLSEFKAILRELRSIKSR